MSSPDFDARRRRIVLGTGAALLAPLLNGCGSGSGGSGSDGGGPYLRPDIPPQPPIQPGLALQPRGIHLSFAGDPLRSRAVTWFTDGLRNPGSVVEYGPVEPGMSPEAIQGTPLPHRAEGYVQEAYDIDVLTHRAFMDGIDPELPLRYRVGHEGMWSPVFVVKAAPTGSGFRFCQSADMGATLPQRWVVGGLARNDPDFFLLPGDLSYADGTQSVWDDYFANMQALTAQVPMMAVPGNHEENDGNGDGYLSRTTHMQPQQGARGWYSFTFRNVHFCCSTAGSFADDGQLESELAFIEADLAEASARRARGEIDFIVLTSHYPLWTDEEGDAPNSEGAIALFEDTILRYGVDIHAVGHDHIYQRSQRFARGVPDPDGYFQVMTGNGGKSMRAFEREIGPWSGAEAQRYGFTEYRVEGTRIRGTTYAVDIRIGGRGEEALHLPALRDEVIDEFEIEARSMLARQDYVQPARGFGTMLAQSGVGSAAKLHAAVLARNAASAARDVA